MLEVTRLLRSRLSALITGVLRGATGHLGRGKVSSPPGVAGSSSSNRHGRLSRSLTPVLLVVSSLGGVLLAAPAGATGGTVSANNSTVVVSHTTKVIPVNLHATRVNGYARVGRTVTLTIVGTGFYGHVTVTSNEAGTRAVVTHESGKLLTVRVTVRAGSRKGEHTFTIRLANGKSCRVNYYVAPTYTVPNLTGDSVAAAESAIKAAGLALGTVTAVTVGATAANNGAVVPGTQSPASGTSESDPSTKVSFSYYNYVAPTYTVPNLTGDSAATAESAISAAGLALGTVTAVTVGATAANSGTVVRGTQSPASGTSESASSTKVSFSYYNYVNYVAPTYTVPNLTGDSVAAAESAISAAGLALGTVTAVTAGATADNNGKVVTGTQSPASGTSESASSTTVSFSYYNYFAPTDTITFNSEGGSTVSPMSGNDGSTITLPGAPTRAGYTFDGWFAASSGGTALTSPYTLAGDATLHAQWTANATYTVPDLTGDSVAAAESAISTAGLALGTETAVTAGATVANNGKVVPGTQSPASGTSESDPSTTVSFSYYSLA